MAQLRDCPQAGQRRRARSRSRTTRPKPSLTAMPGCASRHGDDRAGLRYPNPRV